jgi:hypothetical protein
MAGAKGGAVPGAGIGTGNRILDSLAAGQLGMLMPALEPIRLVAGEVLAVTGAPMAWSLFPGHGAVISLVAVEAGGQTAEAVSVGAEGVVGPDLAALPGFGRLQVQLPGPAYRVASAALDDGAAGCPELQAGLAAAGRALLAQALQTAVCTALHTVEARAARWMLMAMDRLGHPDLPTTQESLADLLGVRRTTVTRVIAQLEEKKLIRHRRGRVAIQDQAGLEGVACACHAALMQRLRHVAPALYPTP